MCGMEGSAWVKVVSMFSGIIVLLQPAFMGRSSLKRGGSEETPNLHHICALLLFVIKLVCFGWLACLCHAQRGRYIKGINKPGIVERGDR